MRNKKDISLYNTKTNSQEIVFRTSEYGSVLEIDYSKVKKIDFKNIFILTLTGNDYLKYNKYCSNNSVFNYIIGDKFKKKSFLERLFK